MLRIRVSIRIPIILAVIKIKLTLAVFKATLFTSMVGLLHRLIRWLLSMLLREIVFNYVLKKKETRLARRLRIKKLRKAMTLHVV